MASIASWMLVAALLQFVYGGTGVGLLRFTYRAVAAMQVRDGINAARREKAILFIFAEG